MKKNTLSNYKAVILAGGKGTRLYPITREIPKPLLPINKKPIINYSIDLFYSQGIKDIAVLVNYNFREEFKWWKKRYYPKNKLKIVEEKKPLGTFGGIYLLKKWISNSYFFVTNGDELKEVNLKKMNDFCLKLKVPATIALTSIFDPQHYGVVICDKEGRVEKFLEKPKNPPSKYINSGLYLFSPEIFNYLPRRQTGKAGPRFLMVETYLFPMLTKERKLAGFKFRGRWIDCGTWRLYEKAFKRE